MSSYLKISLALLALAFGVILWQGGRGTTITYLGVAPLVLWIGYLLIWAGIGFLKDRKSKNLNSVALLALVAFPVSEKMLVALLLAMVLAYIIGRAIATASVMEYGDRRPMPKWYNNPKFSLVPLLRIKEANEHNTRGFQFDWLFLRLWSLDSFGFEFSLVADNHWGVGFVGALPYLRWTCCIPCPERIGMWVQANLWRRPKPQQPKPWFMKKTACSC